MPLRNHARVYEAVGIGYIRSAMTSEAAATRYLASLVKVATEIVVGFDVGEAIRGWDSETVQGPIGSAGAPALH